MELSDGCFFGLRECQMAEEDWGVERQGVHILRAGAVNLVDKSGKNEQGGMAGEEEESGKLTLPPRASSAHWASASEGALVDAKE